MNYFLRALVVNKILVIWTKLCVVKIISGFYGRGMSIQLLLLFFGNFLLAIVLHSELIAETCYTDEDKTKCKLTRLFFIHE